MLREEERSPADYIIFNIFKDDHYRSIEGWGAIRHRRCAEGQVFWATKPSVRLCPATGDLIEVPSPDKEPKIKIAAVWFAVLRGNLSPRPGADPQVPDPCSTLDAALGLAELGRAVELFRDDVLLHAGAVAGREARPPRARAVCRLPLNAFA
jgi:hypothetical protein